MPIDALNVTVRGHILREAPSCFQDMIFDVRLEGKLTEEQVATLAREASELCFVENTLAKAIPIETEVKLNDRKIVTLHRDPAGNPEGSKGAKRG